MLSWSAYTRSGVGRFTRTGARVQNRPTVLHHPARLTRPAPVIVLARLLVSKIETERVTIRVQVNADVVLGLVFRERCPTRFCMGATQIEVLDADLEVDHHLLLARLGWPDR